MLFRHMRRVLASAMLLGTVLTAPVGQVAQAADLRNFQFQNRSYDPVVSLYLEPIDGDWGPDVLGSGYVGSGRYVNIDFDPWYGDTCLYNIGVYTLSGQVDELYAVDLCATTVVTYG